MRPLFLGAGDLENFETRWVHARHLEETGDIESAVHAYEQILAVEPDRLYARLRLCGLLQRQDRYAAARNHALASMDAIRHGRRPADLHHVTRQLLFFGEYEHVKNLILHADWNRVEILGTSPILIQHLWLCGEVAQALALCEHVLALVPDHAALNYSHGILLNYAGRPDESAQAFERCLARDPAHAGAHWSLAYLRKSDPPGKRIPALQDVLSMADAGSDSAIYLNYALFKEYDDAGQTDAAWTHLQTGADLKRKSLDYDASRERSVFRALLGIPLPTRRQQDDGARPPRHIFIVGMPRTGTTVLDRIFGNHPQVTSAGELGEFRSILSAKLGCSVDTRLGADIVARIAELPLRDVGEMFVERVSWRLQPGRPILLDKNPENFMFSAWIATALEDAKIICLRRKPMDACFSNLKELFTNESYGYSYRLEELAAHYDRFDQLARHWHESMPDRFMLMDYEHLVTNPEESAARLFAFCGLSYQPMYSDITRNLSTVSTASAAQVRQPIDTGKIDAWKRYAVQLEPLTVHLESLGHAID